jgi:hypothetical protein
MSAKTKNRRYKELDAAMENHICMFVRLKYLFSSHVVANSGQIVASWHVEKAPMMEQTFSQIGKNFAAAKTTLPKTSTVNTTILKIGSIGTIGFKCGYLSLQRRFDQYSSGGSIWCHASSDRECQE